MEEIKFRAKAIEKSFVKSGTLDGWVYGTYFKDKNEYFMVDEITGSFIKINSETIGQFICLKDKNDKEIYEGDIIVSDNFFASVVIYDNQHAQFVACDINFLDANVQWEVTGNIYENPDLIKET